MTNADGWGNVGWAEWKGRMGAKIENLEANDREVFKILGRLREDVAMLKGKAAMAGAVGGGLVGGIWMFVKMIVEKG